MPEVENQHTPMFTGEEITKIIAKAEKQERVICVLFAASGLRAGELFGLEVKHFNGVTITVAQSLWEGRVQTPQTENAFRQVDLNPSVNNHLSNLTTSLLLFTFGSRFRQWCWLFGR